MIFFAALRSLPMTTRGRSTAFVALVYVGGRGAQISGTRYNFRSHERQAAHLHTCAYPACATWLRHVAKLSTSRVDTHKGRACGTGVTDISLGIG